MGGWDCGYRYYVAVQGAIEGRGSRPSIRRSLSCYVEPMRKKSSESKLHGDSTVLGARAFAAISAVEGLKLTPAGRNRVHCAAPIEQRRAEVLRAYMDLKGPK